MTWQEEESRRVYAQRVVDAKAYQATLDPASEEYQRMTTFIAELEASEFLKENS